MVSRRAGLGKGLEALIPQSRSGDLEHIPIDRISPNPDQPRKGFDDEALKYLTDSIRRVGILQPVVVRPAGSGYILIAGERRWRAATEAGLPTIPALIRETDTTGSLTEALIENLQREDLTPLEEAAAYQQLEEDFDMTHAEIAKRVGRSRAAVTNTLRLLKLSPFIQKALNEGALSAGHARALLGLKDQALAEHLARQAIAGGWPVRRLEKAVKAGKGRDRPRREIEPRHAAIIELEQRLAEQLGTTVRINYRNDKGQVVLKFASLDQLEQIYRRLFPT